MRREAAIVADAVSALIGNGCVIDARNKCSLGWWIFSSFEITCKGVKFNVEKVQTFKSLFINEFRPGHSAQKIENTIVYHYTGACSLLSILENECVRFSDIRYMNDRSETIFFVKRLIEFITENGDQHPFFRDVVNQLLAENDYDQILDLSIDKIKYKDIPGLKMQAQRAFIFCTCDEPDLLNMWNYYASSGTYTGYNIGLSVINFLKTFDVEQVGTMESFIVYYGHVLYTKKQQFEEIKSLAKEIDKYSLFDSIAQGISHATVTIRQYIETRGPFFKNDSFRAEKEYRFLFSIANDRIPHSNKDANKYFGKYNKKLCEGFCERRGVIVPYMQVAIPENSISRITMSPMMEYEIAKSSIKELLKVKGILGTNKTEVPIFKSKIPIRF